MSLILVYPLIIICCHKIQWHIHHLHVCSSSTPEFNILLSIGRTWQHLTHVYLASGPPFYSNSFATHMTFHKRARTFIMKSLDLDVPPFRRAVVERPGTIEPRIRDMNTSQPKVVSQVLNSQVLNSQTHPRNVRNR